MNLLTYKKLNSSSIDTEIKKNLLETVLPRVCTFLLLCLRQIDCCGRFTAHMIITNDSKTVFCRDKTGAWVEVMSSTFLNDLKIKFGIMVLTWAKRVCVCFEHENSLGYKSLYIYICMLHGNASCNIDV